MAFQHKSAALLLSGLTAGVLMTAAAPHASAYTIDAKNKLVTIEATDNTAAINKAFAYLLLRADKATPWTVKFSPGKYVLTQHIYADNLQNVSIVSDGAALMKDPKNFTTEYLFYSRFAKNVSIKGFLIAGKTKVFDPKMNTNLSHPAWGDQGLYFGSCDGVTIENNRIIDFGNGAIRVTTSNADPVKGVHSFNTKVINNVFNNVYQISTTSNDTVHGATANYLFQGNALYNLHGSVKFATRTPGAQNVIVKNNIIYNGDHYGFEINNFSNFTIASNTLQNLDVAMTIYTGGERSGSSFQWGDNYIISNNKISNANRAIRFSPDQFPDGFKPLPHNLTITGNVISDMKDSYQPAIAVNGKVDGLTITGNQLNNVANTRPISYTATCTKVSVLGNTINSKAYTVAAR